MYFPFIFSFDTGLHSQIEENNIKLKILTKFESFSSSVHNILYVRRSANGTQKQKMIHSTLTTE